MRWSREGLAPLLQLRASIGSNDWDEIWENCSDERCIYITVPLFILHLQIDTIYSVSCFFSRKDAKSRIF
jgi:hypothetical protein